MLDSAHPLTPTAKISLTDVERIEIGRGKARAISFSGRSNGLLLRIELPDSLVSQRHLRIVKRDRRWHAEDLDSKNGTLLFGQPLRAMAVRDGAALHVGHHVICFREEPAGEPRQVLADGDAGPDPALASFDARFAKRCAAAARAATAPQPILLLGETGTGKEVVARALHGLSGRNGPFIAVNCAAIPEPVLASELFGHRRGAFSGAERDHEGLIRAADGGTLLLDELGDLPMAAQVALLRVLQQGEVQPLGTTRPIKVNVRFMAATHRDVEKLVARGSFREDLLARLSGHVLELPPLRHRMVDFGLLLRRMLSAAGQGRPPEIAPAAIRAMFAHAWPRNVRELELALGSALTLADGPRISVEHLPDAVLARRDPPARRPAAEAKAPDKSELIALLREHRGNVTAVAEALGRARMQVHRWAKQYAIDLASFRSGKL